MGSRSATEFIIGNKQGQILDIVCSPEGMTYSNDHSIYFTLKNGQTIEGVSFLIDGEAYYPLSYPTSTRLGGQQWDKFISVISQSTSFDVYHGNEKLGSFFPSVKSMKKNAPGTRGMSNCTSYFFDEP